jgi:hypothetical protein
LENYIKTGKALIEDRKAKLFILKAIIKKSTKDKKQTD